MEAAAVEDEWPRPRIGAGLERSAEQDRVVAACELAVELAREPGDRASEDGNAVDELVRHARELLLATDFRREAPGDLLLVRCEHVDAEATGVADRRQRVRAVIERDEDERGSSESDVSAFVVAPRGPESSRLVTTATPVGQLAISRRSSCASSVVVTPGWSHTRHVSDSAVAEKSFDVVVIGAGPAGEVVAGRLGEAGVEVAVVEQHLVGGECSYYACMPSKSLLRPGELLAETGRVPGLRADGVDVEAVLARRDEVIHDRDDSSQVPWLEERGVTLVRGHGRLDGEKRVRVDDDVLVARQAVVVATGSGPAVPPIPGLAEARPWGNREATTAKEAPESLVILGGGVVGVELAQAWSSLGTEVVLLEGAPRVIVREEPFASAEVAAALVEAGVDGADGEPRGRCVARW